MLSRALAQIGATGLLCLLLAISAVVHVWQIRRAAQASAACESRIMEMQRTVAEEAARADLLGLSISRDIRQQASADAARIQTETVRYVTRIREVPVHVPAECDGPMPAGVQDALRQAAAAADRGL